MKLYVLLTLWLEASHLKSPLIRQCSSGDITPLVNHVISEDLYEYGFLAIFHCLAMFVDYRHCSSGDTIYLICHVTSQDHVIKGSCDLIGKSLSR